MDKVFIISSVIILLIILFLIIIRLKELKQKQNYTAEEVWRSKKQKYKEEINSIECKKTELLEHYNKLLENVKQLSAEIKLKEDFNGSLYKIREDELQRILEEKKKEGIRLVNLELEKIHQEKLTLLNAEFDQFKTDQEKVKSEMTLKLDQIKNEFEEFRSQREAINLAILREKEIKDREDFYKIIVPVNDQEDMETLKSISPRLRNREALNKLIYDVFVKRPLGELIKRITNGKEISGIYKITYIKTGEAYIGKTTNISTRWQNHIKTACGLEGAARTTFHNRLEQDGLWNYTFEILEEVSKDKLGEREKFYINLYGTDKQLNMKKGG